MVRLSALLLARRDTAPFWTLLETSATLIKYKYPYIAPQISQHLFGTGYLLSGG
jgi:hypothetical protein